MEKPFSSRLEGWIKSKQQKNLATLIEAFGDKSFAVIMFVLMLIPATPLPTALPFLEVIVIIVAFQMIIGRKSVWIPKFLSEKVNLRAFVKSKFMKNMIKKTRWLEDKAGPYGVALFRTPAVDRVFGLIIVLFAATALVAPPFSALDTLPALGIVVLSLAILLENTVLLLVGLVIGTIGMILSFFFAALAVEIIQRVF